MISLVTNLKLTLRTLKREKLYAAINLLGLTVAMVCSLLIGLHVYQEMTYDQHTEGHKKIYRATIDLTNQDGTTRFALMSQFMAPILASQNPDIEDYVRFNIHPENSLVRIDGEPYYWDPIYEADDNVFRVFGHEIIYGDAHTALVDPAAVAISKHFNDIHFGGTDSVGSIISINDRDYRVSLVFDDLPANSHLKYDVLLSINGLTEPGPGNRVMSLFTVNTYTYFVLPENYDMAGFSSFFDDFWERVTGEVLRGSGLQNAMAITPIADVHYGEAAEFDQPPGNIFIVYAYAIVGLLILLVACINYINLATARASRRFKEVGIRKILGAGRGELVIQFLLESVTLVLFAVVLAMTLIELMFQSGIATSLNSELNLDLYRRPGILVLIGIGGLVLGLLAGSYPAWWTSSQFAVPSGNQNACVDTESSLRKALVIFQFAVAVSVVASSLLIVNQMRFIANAPLGFDKDNRLVLFIKGIENIVRAPVLTDQMLSLPEVAGVSFTAQDPAIGFSSGNWLLENNDGALESRFLSFQSVDTGFLDVMGIELVLGRSFDAAAGRDQVVVNETLVRRMGWEEPIGKRTGIPGNLEGSEIVVGVIKDFHYSGLQAEIGPLILRPTQPQRYGAVNPQLAYDQTARITLSLAPGSNARTLEQIEAIWFDLMPDLPFSYRYLDNIIAQSYSSENRMLSVISYFAAISIFVSCLGLLGLSAYTTERRTREIGIRKILGASALQIMGMLFRNIFVLVFIGAVIAAFVSYYSVNAWLENFSYRDEINLMVFPVAAVLAVLAAFLTMSAQAWSTITKNPVHALRYE